MIEYHQTVSCPNCNKDSYASSAEAYFGEARCVWCNCTFKYQDGKYVVTSKGKK